MHETRWRAAGGLRPIAAIGTERFAGVWLTASLPGPGPAAG